jgi:hypothetical protein
LKRQTVNEKGDDTMIRPDSPEVPNCRSVPRAPIINEARCGYPERGSLKKRLLEEDLQLDEFNDRLAQRISEMGDQDE